MQTPLPKPVPRVIEQVQMLLENAGYRVDIQVLDSFGHIKLEARNFPEPPKESDKI